MPKGKYTTVSHTVIMKYLMENRDKLVTVNDIDAYLKKEGIDVNITTVYRFLNKLSDGKEVIKYMAGKGEMSSFQYVGDSRRCMEHLHLHCNKCGKIIHLECGFMNEISSHIMEHHGFALQCEASVLYGLCSECRKEGG
ncbi:MAG: Fur family transcriptional regulator [Butyrivibrio sp.]